MNIASQELEQRFEEIVCSHKRQFSGQLVCYIETTSRWSFARIRRIRDEEVDLCVFDGPVPMTVLLAQVEPQDAFLGGQAHEVADAFPTYLLYIGAAAISLASNLALDADL